MIKQLITDISEEDFRKLDIKVWKHEKINTPHGTYRLVMVEHSMNDILDKQLECILSDGYQEDEYNLSVPVTIAIHEDPTEEDIIKLSEEFKGLNESEIRDMARFRYSYLDKFMNRYTGAQTYQFAFGIKHLYSTRDYYEAHEDYWRVRKDETKVIYRVKLSKEWSDKFELKHKTVTEIWPYDILPGKVSQDYKSAFLCKCFDKINGEWVEVHRYGRFIYEHSECHIPVDKDGYEIRR